MGGGRPVSAEHPGMISLEATQAVKMLLDETINVPPFSENSTLYVVTVELPMTISRNQNGEFEVNKSNYTLLATLYNLRNTRGGLSTKFVGWPGIHPANEAEAQQIRDLLDPLDCVPVFPPADAFGGFMSFCHRVLWPLFHNVVQVDSARAETFDLALWQTYQACNKAFAEAVASRARDGEDVVWVHDYPLLLVPQHVTRWLRQVSIGFFLHSAFPSSELFRTLPVREEILRGLLCADLVGFQFFEYARHFLVAAKRIVGADHRVRLGGLLQVDYEGRPVMIRVNHAFLDPSAVRQQWASLREEVVQEAAALRAQVGEGTFVLGSIDRCDFLSGVDRKIEAFAAFLRMHPRARGRVVLVQLVYFPTVAAGHTSAFFQLISEKARQVNLEFRHEGLAVVLKPGPISVADKWALYLATDCYVDASLKQGLSLTPLELLLVRSLHAPPCDLADSVFDPPGMPTSSVPSQQTVLPSSFFCEPPDVALPPPCPPELTEAERKRVDLADVSMLPPGVANCALRAALLDPASHGPGRRHNSRALGAEGAAGAVLCGSQPYCTMIISEFTGVSRVLASAVRVNPYDTAALTAAFEQACNATWPSPLRPPSVVGHLSSSPSHVMPSGSSFSFSNSAAGGMSWEEAALCQASDVEMASHHSAHQWSEAFLLDLRRATRGRGTLRMESLGLGAGMRVYGLDASFQPLNRVEVIQEFKRADKRLLFLDYEGTLVTGSAPPAESETARLIAEANLQSEGSPPSAELLDRLERLCADPRNYVVVLSGRPKSSLEQWLGQVPRLGLCAEHGFRFRLPGDRAAEGWQTMGSEMLTEGGDAEEGLAVVATAAPWKLLTLDVMRQFVARTPGSVIEDKGSALVFQYRAALEDFGLWQAGELHNHLSELLFDQQVDVVAGKGYVEARLRGVHKGRAVEMILRALNPDRGDGVEGNNEALLEAGLVLAVGDDRSDEMMFLALDALHEHALAAHQAKLLESKPAEVGDSSQRTFNCVAASLANLMVTPGPIVSPPRGESATTRTNLERLSSTLQNASPARPLQHEKEKEEEVLGLVTISAVVGKKPSAAHNYLHDVDEVNELLEALSQLQ